MKREISAITELPSDEELIKQIRLTSEIVWKRNLLKDDIDNWLTNFKGEVFDIDYEKKMALWLLANFVFYNDDEVKHLCKTLYKDFIHYLIEEEDSTLDIDLRYKNILKKSRFYHLGKTGESSGYVLYYFRQENQLPLKNFISKIEEIPDIVENIVFVDDVALSDGSKSQASKYIKKIIADNPKLKNCRIILLSFIATDKAIDFLSKENIEVINCITLHERNKCFSKDSIVFSNFNEHLSNGKIFAEHYGKKIKPNNPLGYNNCQFLFGFFYNTPDNTLPIFWAEENDWVPILKRYHKNYQNKLLDLGKFV